MGALYQFPFPFAIQIPRISPLITHFSPRKIHEKLFFLLSLQNSPKKNKPVDKKGQNVLLY